MKPPLRAAVAIVAGLTAAAACTDNAEQPSMENVAMPVSIEQAVAEAGAWADIPGVEAVGQGERDGKPVIRVLVSMPDAEAKLPKIFRNFPVVVEPTEPVSAQEGRP